ncbi:conserved hypothetical protein; hypothetical cytosolic protein [Candidatus Glomeribacter gigasporarum BEG34]|uniref:Transposase n=2 Tax=Candidatus Glomeribacter gigasporarum TaxID=132144 RepID=G2JBL2_9BURK|nr:conserved hypothetical protein; hypothetical cytosolic protein [Candidatus Glomeribacter gigasporarum BEG34]
MAHAVSMDTKTDGARDFFLILRLHRIRRSATLPFPKTCLEIGDFWMSLKPQTPLSESDPAWKILLDVYFPQWMAYFWPTLHQQIDWDKGFESLDSELQSVAREAAVGKRLVDKLFQVHSKEGRPCRVLTHVEIQGQRQTHFAQRLFEYYCRIYLLKGLPLITLVVLVDGDLHWRPQGYEIQVWGQSVLRFNFQIIKILDYRGKEAELDRHPNPFAAVVLAQLAALETKRNAQDRFDRRWQLTRKLFEKGLKRDEIEHLY